MKSEIESRGQLKVELEPIKVQKIGTSEVTILQQSDPTKPNSNPSSGKNVPESAVQKVKSIIAAAKVKYGNTDPGVFLDTLRVFLSPLEFLKGF